MEKKPTLCTEKQFSFCFLTDIRLVKTVKYVVYQSFCAIVIRKIEFSDDLFDALYFRIVLFIFLCWKKPTREENEQSSKRVTRNNSKFAERRRANEH